MIPITLHALLRFRQRVADLTDEQIRTTLDVRAVHVALAIGAPFVRLPTGQRLRIRRGIIVTVLPKEYWTAAMDRRREGEN